MGSIRVVIDTNVFVSALGFGGTPLEALLRTFEDDVQVLVSAETLDELDRVMSYERLPFTEGEREQFLDILRREADDVESTPNLKVIEADPDDNAFLEIAVAGNAKYVVSGDEHLLAQRRFREIEIVTPSEFLTELHSTKS